MTENIDTAERMRIGRARITLKYYEDEITKAGRALAGIFKRLRDDSEKPYLLDYPSFEAYCEGRWGMTRQRAWQLISAETTRQQLADVPETAAASGSLNNRQLLEVSRIEPEKRAAVIAKAQTLSPKMTAKTIKQARAIVIDAATVEQAAESVARRCPHCGLKL